MVVGYEPVNLTAAYAMETGRRYTFQNTTQGETGFAVLDVREPTDEETENTFIVRPGNRPWTLLQQDELDFFCRSPDPSTQINISLIEQS